jgi:glycosyltransferase involved in cell wall biosynthesis
MSADRRPLRVAMVVASHYDSDARVRRQAEALAERGDEVTVLALADAGRPRSERLDGVNVVRPGVGKYQGDSVRSYVARYASFAARAAAWLGRRPRGFDLVQVHSMPEALVFSAAVQRALGVPVVLDVHDLSSQLFASKFVGRERLRSAVGLSERVALATATEVMTVHDHYADTLRGLTRRPVSVVMNCPDDRLFEPRPWRGWDPAGEVVFGYHGLIAERHQLPEAAEALAAARERLPGARMEVFGAGDGLPALRAHVERLGLGARVALPQRLLAITEMVRALDRVDIGLLPSRIDPWTNNVLPNKLLEYAYVGIPVVTFRNPVIERYFPPDAVSYADPATPETLREAMVALASNPERAAAQAARAREAMSGLAWSDQRGRYFDVIDRLGRGG